MKSYHFQKKPLRWDSSRKQLSSRFQENTFEGREEYLGRFKTETNFEQQNRMLREQVQRTICENRRQRQNQYTRGREFCENYEDQFGNPRMHKFNNQPYFTQRNHINSQWATNQTKLLQQRLQKRSQKYLNKFKNQIYREKILTSTPLAQINNHQQNYAETAKYLLCKQMQIQPIMKPKQNKTIQNKQNYKPQDFIVKEESKSQKQSVKIKRNFYIEESTVQLAEMPEKSSETRQPQQKYIKIDSQQKINPQNSKSAFKCQVYLQQQTIINQKNEASIIQTKQVFEEESFGEQNLCTQENRIIKEEEKLENKVEQIIQQNIQQQKGLQQITKVILPQKKEFKKHESPKFKQNKQKVYSQISHSPISQCKCSKSLKLDLPGYKLDEPKTQFYSNQFSWIYRNQFSYNQPQNQYKCHYENSQGKRSERGHNKKRKKFLSIISRSQSKFR